MDYLKIRDVIYQKIEHTIIIYDFLDIILRIKTKNRSKKWQLLMM